MKQRCVYSKARSSDRQYRADRKRVADRANFFCAMSDLLPLVGIQIALEFHLDGQ